MGPAALVGEEKPADMGLASSIGEAMHDDNGSSCFGRVGDTR